MDVALPGACVHAPAQRALHIDCNNLVAAAAGNVLHAALGEEDGNVERVIVEGLSHGARPARVVGVFEINARCSKGALLPCDVPRLQAEREGGMEAGRRDGWMEGEREEERERERPRQRQRTEIENREQRHRDEHRDRDRETETETETETGSGTGTETETETEAVTETETETETEAETEAGRQAGRDGEKQSARARSRRCEQQGQGMCFLANFDANLQRLHAKHALLEGQGVSCRIEVLWNASHSELQRHLRSPFPFSFF